MLTKIGKAPICLNFLKFISKLNFVRSIQGSGHPGSGAGRGGGAGGSVRESGGGLGEYGVAQEEGYFYKKQAELLKKIKEKLQRKPQSEDKPKTDA